MDNLKSFLKNILSFTLKDKYINILIQEDHLILFNTIYDENNKYNEYYNAQGKLTISRVYNNFYEPNLFENKIFESLSNTQIETFFGILEYILDQYTKIGVGYAICYQTIDKLLSQQNKKKIIKQSQIFKEEEKEFVQKKYDQGVDLATIFDHYLSTYRQNKLKEVQKIDDELKRKFMLDSWYYIDWKKSENKYKIEL